MKKLYYIAKYGLMGYFLWAIYQLMTIGMDVVFNYTSPLPCKIIIISIFSLAIVWMALFIVLVLWKGKYNESRI